MRDHRTSRGTWIRPARAMLTLCLAVTACACGPGGGDGGDGDGDGDGDAAAGLGDAAATDGGALGGGDAAAGTDGLEPAAVSASVGAAFVAMGVAEDQRIWSLARYPRALAAGEEVIDWQGAVMATAPAESELLFADLAPWAQWQHPAMLFFMDTATGELLGEVSVGWWPIVALDGDADAPWGGGDPTAIGDGDWLRAAPPLADVTWNVDPDAPDEALETFAGGAQSAGSGSKCEPTRHAIIVLGKPAGLADLTSDRKANEAVMRRLFTSPGFGIPDAQVKTVEGKGKDKSTSWSDVKDELGGLDLQCCDEVFFYYTAHGAEAANNDELTGAPALGGGSNPNEDIITPKNMADFIAGSKACKWALIADSCYSGNFMGGVRSHLKKDDKAKSKTVVTFAAAYSDEVALNAVWRQPDGSSVLGGAYTQLVLRGVQRAADTAIEAWSFGTAIDKIKARQPSGKLTGEYVNQDTGETDFASQTPTSSTISGEGPCCECETTADCKQPAKECRCAECVEGECVERNTAPGDPCDDGDKCTIEDVCHQGEFCWGVPNPCDDGNSCTTDSCEATTGACKHVALAVGAACDDGDKCTEYDECKQDGSCKGLAKICEDNDVCTTNACADGVCHYPAAPPGTPCLDAPPCTAGELCVGKKCTPTEFLHLVCELDLGAAERPCTTAMCTEAGCSFVAITAGACEVAGAPGTCQAGGTVPSSGTGTAGKCVPDGQTGCTLDSECADADLCTTDSCADGACVHLVTVCNDDNPCTEPDACNAATGACDFPAKDCDDGIACTIDTCQFSPDCVHVPVDCNDGDACTTDSCEPATGQCINAPVDCDDGNECTLEDCGQDDGCVHQPLSGQACDDGDPCTDPDVCWLGVCGPGDNVCSTCPCALCPQSIEGPPAFQMPQGGWVLPDMGGQPLPAQLEPSLEFLAFEAFEPLLSLDQMGGRFLLPGPLPAQSPLPYQGALFSHDISIAWFGPGQGQPLEVEPPLAGATHRLSASYTDEAQGWVGHLWVYDGLGEAGGWTLAEAAVPLVIQGNELVLQASTGLPPCTPFKVFTQVLVDDPNSGQTVRALRMGTAPDTPAANLLSTDPNGPPIQLDAAGLQ